MKKSLINVTELDNKKKAIAGKPNLLIESRISFKDIHEYRLFLAMLYKAYDGVDINKPFDIDISFIVGNGNKCGRDYNYLRNACINIMSRVIDLLPRNERAFQLRHLVDKADFNEKLKNGKVRVSFHPDVVPHILAMFKEGRYTKIFLKHALPIRSLYSIKIYELLLQFKNLGSRNINLLDFKFLLNIPDEKFKHWNNIKQKILIPAQRHLKEFTDIKFDFTPIQKGKKVIGINFRIFDNIPEFKMDSEQLELFELNSIENKKNDLISEHLKIVQQNIWPETQKEVLDAYSPERITYYYNYCKKLQESGKNINNFSSFFLKALSEDRDNFEAKMREINIKAELLRKSELDKLTREKLIEEEFNELEKRFNELSQEEQACYIRKVSPITFKTYENKRIAAIGIFGKESKKDNLN